MLHIQCEQRPYGRSISTIVKYINNKKDISKVKLYNVEQLIIKGDIKDYVEKYRNKMKKKSHVKNPSVHKKKLTKNIRSIITHSFRHMVKNKRLNFELLLSEKNEKLDETLYSLNLPRVQLPIRKGFNLEQLVNEL